MIAVRNWLPEAAQQERPVRNTWQKKGIWNRKSGRVTVDNFKQVIYIDIQTSSLSAVIYFFKLGYDFE